jgi:gluconolactonase
MGSDGMTIDAEGNLYLTGHGITVFDRSGKQIDHIDVPEPWTGNICLGGKDHKTLFITASKSLYSIRLRVAGANPAK